MPTCEPGTQLLRVGILHCALSCSLCLALGLAHSRNWNDSQLSHEGSAEVTQVNTEQRILGKGSSLKKAGM